MLLVALSKKGLCAILIDDEASYLQEELKKRFPEADLIKDEKITGETHAKVVDLIDHPQHHIPIRLDERGTLFQKQVWQALREIPVGKTTTYSAIAQQLGRPLAVRAVGAACGANPLAVLTPCHRVLSKDGKLTGFRWGKERKLKLLQNEGLFPGVSSEPSP